ncbi:MAG: protein kinase [Pseudomonadota bacterium]
MPAAIGPYRVEQLIGSGGVGVVYRASHQRTGEVVAVKTVGAAREGHLASVRREIEMLQQIRHRGIVRIFDGGVFEGRPWYAM